MAATRAASIVSPLCCICFEDSHEFVCCESVCLDCGRQHMQSIIRDARLESLHCPSCNQHYPEATILSTVDAESVTKYFRFKAIKEDPAAVDCPVCSARVPLRTSERERHCDTCGADFCSLHGVSHSGRRCPGVNMGGPIASLRTRFTKNVMMQAAKCPRCRISISRSAGCDHMTCSNCRCHFCYLCANEFNSGTYSHRCPARVRRVVARVVTAPVWGPLLLLATPAILARRSMKRKQRRLQRQEAAAAALRQRRAAAYRADLVQQRIEMQEARARRAEAALFARRLKARPTPEFQQRRRPMLPPPEVAGFGLDEVADKVADDLLAAKDTLVSFLAQQRDTLAEFHKQFNAPSALPKPWVPFQAAGASRPYDHEDPTSVRLGNRLETLHLYTLESQDRPPLSSDHDAAWDAYGSRSQPPPAPPLHSGLASVIAPPHEFQAVRPADYRAVLMRPARAHATPHGVSSAPPSHVLVPEISV